MSRLLRSFDVRHLFTLTVLTSAFLIFQIQPLISKCILPWFGGTPGVWSICMLFFQGVLFLGYAYAHLLNRRFSFGQQVAVHATLLGVSLLLLPILPSSAWKPTGSEDPTWRILGLLACSVGMPYFLLSATGPLLQSWFARRFPGQSPYRLYAVSNIGSVAGLISYPFVVEPWLNVSGQALTWSTAFGLFALLCGLCGWLASRHFTGEQTAPAASSSNNELNIAPEETPTPVRVGDRVLWFALSATASCLLLAMTNQVCLDVAVIPFLWVLPLTLYLLSFILCFDGSRWYPRRTMMTALGVSIACLCGLLFIGDKASIVAQIAVYFTTLFLACMVCHGELARLKPHPRELTAYYMLMSAGGACGGLFVGLFVGLISPLLFSRYIELHLGVAACWLLMLVVLFREPQGLLSAGRNRQAWCGLVLLTLILLRTLRSHAGEVLAGELEVRRNFYGVLKVATLEGDRPDQQSTVLVHGRILHGRQFTQPEKQQIPTAYYGEQSGVGQAIARLRSVHPHGLKIGVVGLGVGTLAAYGQPGDQICFYEINPDVVDLAQRHFRYLSQSAAHIEHRLGDARLVMESEPDQQFHLLVLDAFSSDAIPAHLLTREAFAIYARHLRSDGLLAAHISNRHFELTPVVAGGAQSLNWSWRKIHSAANDDRGQMAADWLLLTADEERLPLPELPGSYAAIAPQPRTRLPRIVTISDAIPETGESVSKADSSQVDPPHNPTGSETEQTAPGKSDRPIEAAVEPIQWTDQYSPVLEILK